MRLNEVTLYENKSHRILQEGWHQLTEVQQNYQLRWERELFPLLEKYCRLAEADLTTAQIQAIFQGAEETAMSGGNNKTSLGKAGSAAAGAVKMSADLAKQVNAKINELGKLAKNTGPVKNADQKFNDLKAQITANNSDSKVVQGIQKISDWAKENPGKASLAVGILTAMAAFSAGPAGGAAIGLILRQTKGLLQGEDLSTATGKAIKTAAVGALAGMALDNLGDMVLDNFAAASEAEIDGMISDFENANVEMAMNNIDPELQALFPEIEDASRYTMSGNINRFYYNYDIVFTPELMDEYESLKSAVDSTKTFSDEFYQNSAKLHDWLAGVQNDTMQSQYKSAIEALKTAQESEALSSQQWDAVIAADDELTDKLNALSNLDDSVAAAAQAGAQAAADDKKQAIKVSKPKEPEQGELPLDNPNESLSMEERFEIYLAEADPKQGELKLDNPNSLGAKLKRGVKGVVGKAAGAVKQGAKDIGNKVTANKLMKTWKSMGEPLDSGSIANILQDAGLSDEQITSIGQTSKVALDPTKEPAADASGTDTAQKGADSEQPTAKKGPAVKDAPLKKGNTQKIKGKTYKWEGALWTDTSTGRSVGIQAAVSLGLPNPKIDPVRDAIKAAGPNVIKLVIDQINSKGVKAGTKDAQVAKKAGAKGTEKMSPAQNKKPKAGIAKPGTVAAKPKKVRGKV
jgi:hypothetical protein